MDIIIDADLAADQGIIILCLPIIPQTCMTAHSYNRLVEDISAELVEAADEVIKFGEAMNCKISGSPVQVFHSSMRRYLIGKKKPRSYILMGVTLRCTQYDKAEEVIDALIKCQDDNM